MRLFLFRCDKNDKNDGSFLFFLDDDDDDDDDETNKFSPGKR